MKRNSKPREENSTAKPVTKSQPVTAKAASSPKARSRYPVWLLAVLLGLVTISLYWPATSHDFVNYDDQDYVTANVHVQSGLTLESIKWAFSNPVVANWHPLTMLSHMLDCQIYGLKPGGHHLTNVLLHGVNTVLVFLFLRRLTGAIWRSLMVAALFGLHPLHVESVAWVAERKDVLSTFFGLLCLMAYARYAETSRVQSPKSEIGIPTSRYYWLAWIFFALGLMSKVMLVTVPFVLLLLDYWPLERIADCGLRIADSKSAVRPSTLNSLARRSAAKTAQPSTVWRLVKEKIPFFALAAVASVMAYAVQQHSGAMQTIEHLPLAARAGNALISYCRYCGKLFWPANLAVFYPYPEHWPLEQVLLAGGLIIGISVLFFMQRARYPYLLVGWLWYCGTLVPVIGLVQVGGQSMADRYTYIPSLGLLILVIWGAYELTQRSRYQEMALWVAGCAAIVLCIGLTRQQLAYWQDNEALYRHTLAVTEHNYLARHNLGIALYKKGQTDEAISQYREALRLKPDYAEAHYNLGAALGKKGQTDEAIIQFQEAIRLKPDYAEAYNNLGTALGRKGQIDEAIIQFQKALRLKPDCAEFHYDLGTDLGMKGQIDEAIIQFQEALRLKPDYAEARHNLALALEIKNASAGR